MGILGYYWKPYKSIKVNNIKRVTRDLNHLIAEASPDCQRELVLIYDEITCDVDTLWVDVNADVFLAMGKHEIIRFEDRYLTICKWCGDKFGYNDIKNVIGCYFGEKMRAETKDVASISDVEEAEIVYCVAAGYQTFTSIIELVRAGIPISDIVA